MTARIIMPQTLALPCRPGSLFKRPREPRGSRKQFRGSGPVKDEGYLANIRQCPCLNCGMDPCGEAAHVRYNSAAFGRRQALGKRPQTAVPLCADCHRNDPESQHKVGEHAFWHRIGLNPDLVCQDLQTVAGDLVAMRSKVQWWIGQRETSL